MSESNDDLSKLVDALDELGGEPLEIDQLRLDALETRVIEHLASKRGPVRSGAVVAMSRRRRPIGALVLGAVAASLIAMVALAGFFAAGDTSVVIAAADGVEVTLPGGEVIAGSVGLELPEGAEIEVTGFIEISGVRYGVGSYVLVNEELRLVDQLEQLEVNGQGEPAGPTDDGDTPVAPESSTTTQPVDSTEPPAVRPGTTATPDRSSTTVIEESPRSTVGTPTTVRPEPEDTRPTPVTTQLPQPSSTDAPRRTTTTVASSERTTTVSTRSPATTVPTREDGEATTAATPSTVATTTTTLAPETAATTTSRGRQP